MNPDANQPQGTPEEGTPAPTPEATPAPQPTTSQQDAPVEQPAQQPVQPPVPTPVSPFPANGATAAPRANNPLGNMFKGPNKKIAIIIAAIIGALIVLGIIALVVLGTLFPTKKDYRAAVTQLNTVESSYSDLNSDVTTLSYDYSGSTTDTKFGNDFDAFDADLKTFQEENAKLKDLKAVKSGDVAKTYDEYEAKINSFVTYAKDLSTSLKTIRPATVACEDVNSASLLSKCVDALNKLNLDEIPNGDLNTYISTVRGQYKSYLTIVNKIAAIKDPYGDQYDQYKALRDQGYDLLDKISDADSDRRSNLTKHADEVDPSDIANKLSDELVDKANG